MKSHSLLARLAFALPMALNLGGATPSWAQSNPPGALRDGVVIDGAHGVAFAMTPEGLEGINISSGASLWSLPGVRKPLVTSGDFLVAHATRPDSSLALLVIDARSGSVIREITATLPAGVPGSVIDTPGKSFRATATASGDTVTVSWSFATTTDLTTPDGRAQAPRQGAFRVDLATGSIVDTALVIPDQPRFPGALGEQFRSGGLGARPTLVGDVYTLAQRAPSSSTERLVLRRWNSTGAPLSDVVLYEGALAVPYTSSDGRYLVAGREAGSAGETHWALHNAASGARVSELTGRGAPGAFTLVDSVFVHVAQAFGHRVNEGWVDEPLRLRGLWANSGGVLWQRTLLDTDYRGPMPPRMLQPSGGLPRLGTPKRPETSPRPSQPLKSPEPKAEPSALPKSSVRPAPSASPGQDTAPSLAGVTWAAQGPGPITKGQAEGLTAADNAVVGAVHAVVTHPTNADIMYIAGANGGIWKTVNAKAATPSWSRLTDTLESASIGALELDPTDATSNTLVAGTARVSAFATRGGPRRGLLRTTDGGATWSLLPSMAGRNVGAVAPRGTTIVAAVNMADSFTCSQVGVFRSTDTGATFARVTSGGLGGGVAHDLGSDPSNASILYASLTNSTSCGSTDGIYKSTNTGATWTKVSDAAIDAKLVGASNVEFAINKSGHVFVGITTGPPKRQLSGLFRSVDGGASWTSLDLPSTTEGGVAYGIHPGGQGGSHFSIIGDRSNDDILYVGGDRQPGGGGEGGFPNSLGAVNYTGRLFRVDASKTAGTQVSSLTHCGPTPAAGCGGVQSTASNSSPHADSRDMAIDADGNVIEVDDGGVYKRTSPAGLGDWVSLNGNLQVNECHDVAYDTVSDVVFCGTQDVGSAEQSVKGSATWNTINQGDGGDVAVDALTAAGQSTRYSSAQNLGGFARRVFNAANVRQTDDQPALTVQGGGTAMTPLFVTPVAQNALTPARLLFGGQNFFYESLDRGDTLTQLTGASNEGEVNAIAYGGKMSGADNPDLLYVGAGADGSKVFVRTAAGNVLTETATAFPGGTVIDITIDPTDGAKVFVLSLSGTTYKVYASSNSGGTWRDITGNLPTSTEFRSLEFIPGATPSLLAGGYATVQQMAQGAEGVWANLGTGLPQVLVYDLHYDNTDQVLAAGTLGRGAWTLSLGSATQAVAPTVASPTSTAITNTTATLGGDVTSDGGSAISERGVVYSPTAANATPAIGGSSVTKLVSLGTTGAFTTSATGLSAGTAYSFRAFATNAVGTTYSAPVSTFSTTGGVSLSINSVSIVEGNSGSSTLTFTVSLSAASGSTVTVAYATQPGTATAGSDYTSASGTLTFAPGETSKTLGVSVLGETTPESNEGFGVVLSGQTSSTITRAIGQGTILDDDGAHTTPRPQPTWQEFFAVDTLETPYVGDFNGDRKVDIVTFTRQNPNAIGDVYVSLSDGSKFGANTKWHDFFAITTDESVIIGDYNGDGKDDIATWLGKGSKQIYVAISTGTGMTSETVWVDSIGKDPTDLIFAGDANGDGKKDLIAFARKEGKVYVALSDGTKFATPTVWHGFFAVSTFERPRVADVNGDGKADIVTFATDSPTAFGDVYVATSNGTKFVGATGAENDSSKWHDFFAIRPTEEIRVGDLNGDGKQDFFTFLPPPFAQCYSVLSQGTSMADNVEWAEKVAQQLGVGDNVYVGDVNGDGKADIIVFAQKEGKVYVSLAP